MPKNKPLNLSIENVGDSQYLTDHHNRAREALLYLTFSGTESVAEIRAEIEREIIDCDKIPANRKASENDLDSLAVEICAEIESLFTFNDSDDVDESLDVQVLATW